MSTSDELFARARKVIPGGVNSPVRAFGAVGGTPRFIQGGQGSRIRDVDGREYIDCVGSWGPLILGHCHPEVEEAIASALKRGTTFGAPTEAEVELAEIICRLVPSVERVRLTSSGTEACLAAVRLARGFTGRDRIVKFAGCYHGHADSFLIKSGSGALTLGVPSSPGVPGALAELTAVARFNDLDSVEGAFRRAGGEVAAIIVEPVVGNMGTVPPGPGFLQGLRSICDRHGALLILDEVMTGFRVAPGGAQELYGVVPDLTTMGKVIGGGLSIGAVGGRRDIMQMLAPVGPVYQAGTLSGNPVAVAAGLATLKLLGPDVYARLEALSALLEEGVRANLRRLSLPWQFQRVGSMACLFFTDRPVRNWADADTCDRGRFAAYCRAMLATGIYLPPSQFETFFVSAAHTEEDINRTVEVNRKALQAAR